LEPVASFLSFYVIFFGKRDYYRCEKGFIFKKILKCEHLKLAALQVKRYKLSREAKTKADKNRFVRL
jgi:hypothetical protein